jgi:AGZA family xanthine/uracil permease-like MFS transporter
VLERLFALERHGTTISTEVRAGVVTFMTMSYILFVQRGLLGSPPPAGAGMDPGAVVVAACLASAAACLVMGLGANYPVALAPGMGENFFFVTVAGLSIGGTVLGWPVAMTATFLAGALFLVLSFFRVREYVFQAVPEGLKYAIAVGIGVLIAFFGLQKAGIVVGEPFAQVTIGRFDRPETQLALFGLLVTTILWVRRVRGAFLLGIVVTTLAGWAFGLVHYHGFFSLPPSPAPVAFHFDFARTLTVGLVPVLIVFLFLDLFDTIGTLIAVGEQAGLMKEGRLENAGRALLADAVGTVVGASLGSSTVTSYVESTAGVAEGGRTGLTAVVAGLCFLLALFCYPLVEMVGGGVTVTQVLAVGPDRLEIPFLLIPTVAPILILVGCLMMRGVTRIDWHDPTEALPAFLVILGIPLAFNIATGIALGFIAWALTKTAAGRAREVSPLVYALALLFLAYFLFVRP